MTLMTFQSTTDRVMTMAPQWYNGTEDSDAVTPALTLLLDFIKRPC
jgi:hypothetical protein